MWRKRTRRWSLPPGGASMAGMKRSRRPASTRMSLARGCPRTERWRRPDLARDPTGTAKARREAKARRLLSFRAFASLRAFAGPSVRCPGGLSGGVGLGAGDLVLADDDGDD